jgi:flavorubredoxin
MKIAILFDSRTGNTEKLAHGISKGIEEAGGEVKTRKIGEKFPLSIIKDVDAVLFGSPVIYADITDGMRAFLSHVKRFNEARDYKIEGRTAAVFGSYGYDGAWVMEERFKDMVKELGYKVYDKVYMEIDSEIKINETNAIKRASEFGKDFVKSL